MQNYAHKEVLFYGIYTHLLLNVGIMSEFKEEIQHGVRRCLVAGEEEEHCVAQHLGVGKACNEYLLYFMYVLYAMAFSSQLGVNIEDC